MNAEAAWTRPAICGRKIALASEPAVEEIQQKELDKRRVGPRRLIVPVGTRMGELSMCQLGQEHVSSRVGRV